MSCRIFVDKIDFPEKAGATITLSGAESRYVTKVLRLQEGDKIILFNAHGIESLCNISSIGTKSLQLNIDSISNINRESMFEISICQGLPKGKKMDLIIQKCTELGVKEFQPFVSSRSVSRPDSGDDKKERWQKIAIEAARQCGRNFIPSVDSLKPIDKLVEDMKRVSNEETVKIIPWEDEGVLGLKALASKWKKEASAPPKRAIVMIGPEGGFSKTEVDMAKDAGFIPVTLGSRLLRTETAGLTAATILQYVWGDIG